MIIVTIFDNLILYTKLIKNLSPNKEIFLVNSDLRSALQNREREKENYFRHIFTFIRITPYILVLFLPLAINISSDIMKQSDVITVESLKCVIISTRSRNN